VTIFHHWQIFYLTLKGNCNYKPNDLHYCLTVSSLHDKVYIADSKFIFHCYLGTPPIMCDYDDTAFCNANSLVTEVHDRWMKLWKWFAAFFKVQLFTAHMQFRKCIEIQATEFRNSIPVMKHNLFMWSARVVSTLLDIDSGSSYVLARVLVL